MFTAISLNVKGVNRCVDYIRELIDIYNPLFLCLQETWHLENACYSIFRDVSERYLFVEKSGVDSSESILPGRPHGGTAILYSKRIASNMTHILVASKRICAIKIKPDNGTTLIIASVYMPCNNMRVTATSPEYLETISELEMLCDKFSTAQILIAGDWNTYISRRNGQTRCFHQFVNSCDLHLCWDNSISEQAYTCVSDSLGHKSCIDHFLMSSALFENLTTCFVDTNPFNPSDHRDIIIKIKYDTQRMNIRQNDSVSGGIAWHKVHKDDILKYKELCDRAIDEINLPRSMLQCDYLNCTESAHKDGINDLCTDLINITLESGSKCFPKCKPAGKRLAGWNKCIKPLRDDALF